MKNRSMLLSLSDAQLVQLVKEKHNEAFDVLAARHNALLNGIIANKVRNKAEAEDIKQQTLIAAFTHIINGSYSEEAKFKNWLCSIARNECITYLRSVHERFIPLDEIAEPAEELPQEKDALRGKRFGKALRSLGRQYRLIVILHSIKKQSYEKIAARLHIRVRTAYKYFFCARVLLQKEMGR